MANDPGDDDPSLFREAVRGTKLLRAEPRAGARRRRPAARARFAHADREAVLAESLDVPWPESGIESGDELVFRRTGVQETVLRKLRRGEFRVEAEIDLHGLTAVAARAELRAFLASAIARRLRCVRIVHGKGLRSGQRGPVLKHTVNGLLRQVGAVLAFTSARQVDGGTGAVYVLLG
ncbi:MAG: putative DNA endonuclease SmrA [Steroidobacteraceae bacterium]|nr:putative DNA endonuclease SmrA [Steroidobacteraceae bacterium]